MRLLTKWSCEFKSLYTGFEDIFFHFLLTHVKCPKNFTFDYPCDHLSDSTLVTAVLKNTLATMRFFHYLGLVTSILLLIYPCDIHRFLLPLWHYVINPPCTLLFWKSPIYNGLKIRNKFVRRFRGFRDVRFFVWPKSKCSCEKSETSETSETSDNILWL